MVLKIVFLAILIIIFAQLYSAAIWKIQKSRIRLSRVKKLQLQAHELEEYAQSLLSKLETKKGRCTGVPEQLLALCHRQITLTYKWLNARAVKGEKFEGDKEWIFDNYYVVEDEIYKAEKAIGAKKKEHIEMVSGGEYDKKPLAYALAREFIGACQGKFDEEKIIAFLGAYSRHAYISSTGIYMFFDMLRLVLSEHIAYICRKMRLGISAKSEGDIGMCIRAFSSLENMDFDRMFESVSGVVRIFSQDPACVYAKMDTASRRMYVSRLNEICKKAKLNEYEAAERVLSLAKQGQSVRTRHVGYYLSGDGKNRLLGSFGRADKTKNVAGIMYFVFIWGLSAAVGLLTAVILIPYGIWAAVTFAFFITLLATGFMTSFASDVFSRIIKPHIVPKLDFENGVPKEYATFVVTTMLLTDKKAADEAVQNMEDFYLLNSQENIYFGILADYRDNEKNICDEKLCEYAVNLVSELNKKYGFSENKFYFLLRRQVYSHGENKWMGRERKRGAICDFVKLLCEGDTDIFAETSGAERLGHIKYVITLDSDTRLRHDSALQMIGAMAHPLHIPVIDGEKNIVTDGYGIMQPHIDVDIQNSNKTYYSKIYVPYGGVDPYGGARSDVYQDLFGEAIFVGKGIFDVDIFHGVLAERFPAERILSHDLLEGAYLRCALLSDVVLDDSHPQKYLSHLSRLHRWVRGDWQLAGRLGNRVKTGSSSEKNPINALSKYKIFDNLRRSVIVYVQLRLIVAALFLCAPHSYIILALILFLSSYPLAGQIYNAAKMRFMRRMSAKFRSKILWGIRRAATELALDIITLVYKSYAMGDAIIRTLWRLLVSGKKLLSWVTASEDEGKTKTQLGYHFRKMWISPLAGVLMLVAGLFAPAKNYPAFIVLAFLWIAAPLVVNEISLPVPEQKRRLKAENKPLFKELARRMWCYFEDFAVIEENFIPPDNVQYEPNMKIAHRTSPTNIALCLSSILCARDFGFISTEEMVWRIEKTLDTIDKLCKWQNHLFNWYDTRTLEVLEPRYISTVDNGNYIAQLIMLRQGICEYKNRASITKKHLDALLLSARIAKEEGGEYALCSEQLEALVKKEKIYKKECIDAIEKIVQSQNGTDGSMHERTKSMAKKLLGELCESKSKSVRINARIDALIKRISKIIDETSFLPLYNEKRKLFSVGYEVEGERLCNSHFDLLMSEARQTSYIAVARGEVSWRHWFRLGRNMTMRDRHTGLLSWTGTMFEYLMPLLLIKSYPNTVFDESYNFLLREQIKYSSKFSPAYGVSESCYYSFDNEYNYSYKAIGVPSLCLRRGLSDEHVIAPYASVMSAMIAPNSAAENVRILKSLDAYGKYGLFEAVDFTKKRLGKDEDYAIVKSFMVHHIGMSFLALGNLLCDNIMQKRFLSDAQMRASAYLLGEKIPISPDISRASKYEKTKRER